MSTSARVSLIVPARDIAEFLPAALESLLAQTFDAWQAIVIDDGSADATGDVADSFAARDERITVLRMPQSVGLGAARNSGLAGVDTEYFGFVDGDDVLSPNALERWVETLDRTGSDFAAAAYVRLRPQPDGTYATGRIQPWAAAATSPAADSPTLAERPAAVGNVVAWSKLYRTAFWRSHGLRFPGGAYEDQLIAASVYTSAHAFDTIAEPLVQWRLRPGSITASRNELPVLREYISALRAGLGIFLDAGQTDAALERVRLIRSIDLPPLDAIATEHPDDAYRAELRTFTDWLATIPRAETAPADPALTDGLSW